MNRKTEADWLRKVAEIEGGDHVSAGLAGESDVLTRTKSARSSTTRRVNVNFSDSVYRMLEELAERRGKSMAEVLRDSITLEKWVADAQAEGARILVQKGDEIRELLIR
jgi:hypothetical protein